MLSLARRGQGRDRSLAPPLQRGSPAFEPRLFDAGSFRGKLQSAAPASATGRDAARCRGLRAPARCNIVPEGTIEEPGDASSLKLTVARRIRAGQRRFRICPCLVLVLTKKASNGRWMSL